MAQMFHEREDENQVRRSTNSHAYPVPARDLAPGCGSVQPGFDGEGRFYSPAPDTLTGRARQRVLDQNGTSQSMTYAGDLLPRADRSDPTRENGGEKQEATPTVPTPWATANYPYSDPWSQSDRHRRAKRDE